MSAPPYNTINMPQYRAPPYQEIQQGHSRGSQSRMPMSPPPSLQTDSDLAFRVLTEGVQVFDEFNRKKRFRKIERVSLALYEWSLWIFFPLAFITILQYCASAVSVLYTLLFPALITLMLCIEFRLIRTKNHTYLMFYKYAQMFLFAFFFFYDMMRLAKTNPDPDFLLIIIFVTHFAFFMFFLLRVYLVGSIQKILRYQSQIGPVESIRLAHI